MSKIALDNVLTPYEAIQLQYMNLRQMRNRVSDALSLSNLYTMAEEAHSIYSPTQLKQLLSFPTLRDAQEYDAYKWAADLLLRYDDKSDAIKDRYLAICAELRYFRDEHLIKLLTNEESQKLQPLNEFVAYSKLYQSELPFHELIESHTITAKTLFIAADNTLTLNYFLSGMVETPDLSCMKNIKWILTKEKEREDSITTPFGITNGGAKMILGSTIGINHSIFVQYMIEQLSIFSWKLSPMFENESANYVKKLVEDEINKCDD
jgi:hypothetical protein